MKTLFLLCLAPTAWAAPSTIDATHAFAHAPNAGWIHFRPNATDGVAVHLYHLSGKAYGANFGWIDFGDGTPGAGHLYSNSTETDCGVNHDGAGNLSGFAYAANIGWINFGWAEAGDTNRARFDVQTGQFHGYAYSANIGWILLGSGHLQTSSMDIADTDNDHIGDEWELAWFGDLSTADSSTDSDQDGALDLAEYQADTLPLDAADSLRLSITSANPFPGGVQATLGWMSKPTRSYVLETNNSLVPHSWSDSGLGRIAGHGGWHSQVLLCPESSQFFRLKPVLPLADP
jgi:hypothetical protein